MKTLVVRMLGFYLNALALIAPKKAGHKGFLLFCRPFRTPVTGRQKTFLETAEKFTIPLGADVLQGYKWGNGEKKLLFLHGWQSHSYRWKPYVEALSKDDYTIYSLDAPGHGLSGGNFLSVPVYGSIIREFVHEHGEIHTAIAHSLGSFSLLYSFYTDPALKINRVILMAPPGEADDFMNLYKDTLRLTDRTQRYIVEHFLKTYNVKPDYFSMHKFAASVNVNGLIIHDEEDTEAPYKYAPRINEVWKNSRLITTKGLGHNLKSSTVVKEVVDFIEAPAYAEVRNAPLKQSVL